jgi:hypothetical protein
MSQVAAASRAPSPTVLTLPQPLLYVPAELGRQIIWPFMSDVVSVQPTQAFSALPSVVGSRSNWSEMLSRVSPSLTV